MCHLSWCWSALHSIGAHGIWHHLATWRCMAIMLMSTGSTSLQATSSRVLKWACWGWAHTVVGPRHCCTQQWCLALLIGMTCPAGASPHSPTTPPEKGHLAVSVWLLTCEKVSILGRVMWPPLCLGYWVPQTGICGEGHKITHNGLQRKKKDQLACQQKYPNTWGRHRLWHLDVFPQPLEWSVHGKYPNVDLDHKRWFNFNLPYTAEMAWQMLKVNITVLWCLRSNWACLPG